MDSCPRLSDGLFSPHAFSVFRVSVVRPDSRAVAALPQLLRHMPPFCGCLLSSGSWTPGDSTPLALAVCSCLLCAFPTKAFCAYVLVLGGRCQEVVAAPAPTGKRREPVLCGAAGGDRAWCPQALWCRCCSSACLLSRAVLCSSAAVPAFLGFGHCFQQLREARWLLGAGRSHCLQMKPRCSLDPG